LPNDLTSPEAFTALVREHQAAVFRTLTRLTGPGPHVEDLAQEAFLRLYRALPEFRGDAAISTYLYRIVVNLAQDEWKRRRRERGVFAESPHSDDDTDSPAWIESLPGDTLRQHNRNPEQRFADAELQTIVDRELARLTEAERTVLVLYHAEELSYDAIAAALGLPLNTVRTHLHRGRKRLSERIRARMGLADTAETSAARERAAVPLAAATTGGRA
jgi:RNA polymerase sigma-70 factor (ECF subfamily)